MTGKLRRARPAPTPIRLVQFAQSELGLTLTPGQREMLSSFDEGGYSEAVWCCGRRGGKSLLSDVLVLADVALRGDLRRHVRPGEPRVSAIIAPRLDQSQGHIRNCAALAAGSPLLRRLVVSQTPDELVFRNANVIRAYPASSRSLRGDAWSCVVLDELAHYIDGDGNASGDSIVEAATPALSQFGRHGWRIAISTPRWRGGAFFRMTELAQSGRFPHVHYRHLSSHEMNDRLDVKWLEQRRLEDPDGFGREYLAEFVDGASSFLAGEDVVGCRRGTDKLAARPGIEYVGALDPAFSRDAFSMVIAHRDSDDGRVLVDGAWAWRRKGFEATLDEVRNLALQYRIRRLLTDQFSSQAVLEGLRRRGVLVTVKPWDNAGKFEAFTRLKAALTTRAIELPADDTLCEELIGLEARPTPSGATRIAASGQAHDDRATALAAVVHLLLGQREGYGEYLARGVAALGKVPAAVANPMAFPEWRGPAGVTVCPGCNNYGWTSELVGPARRNERIPCATCRPDEHAAAMRHWSVA